MTTSALFANRACLLFAAALMLVSMCCFSAHPVFAANGEIPGHDLLGGDYYYFHPTTSSPLSECIQFCASDVQCRAATLVPAGIQGPQPVCWLKDGHYQVRQDPNMHSYVKPMYIEAEPNVDLYGMDYRSIPASGVGECRSQCQNDPQCLSFTFVDGGMCFLKNGIPTPTNKAGCHSGVIYERAHIVQTNFMPSTLPQAQPQAQPQQQPQQQPQLAPNQVFLPDTDLPGQDIANFSVPSNDYRDCLKACQNDANCRAYTFVAPGVQGPLPQCWLKNGVPVQVQNSNCISGIVR